MANGFERVERVAVPPLAVTYERWRHPCGAEHVHLANGDQHRAFLVALRTPPADDTGLPHILEHTTLCGSRRYPVRDPFFAMLRRSLQTFMNAMTFPDLTAYPFSSQVAKDYDNLLAIYLDAVFRPLLDPLDFAQEGWRLERDDGRWARKGVVYNEMKGAMDSTDAQVEQAVARALLPDGCYRFNSGGEPEAIPRLSHDDLVAFHRRCYRPANACFATYGDIAPERIHAAIAPYVDADASGPLPPPAPQRARALRATVRVPVPLAEGQDELDVTCARVAWLQGDVADLDEVLSCELVDRVLTGHAGAPLRRALEASGLGRSADGTGYQAHYRTGLFNAQLDGLAVADYPRFTELVDATLAAIARDDVPADELAAAVHQLELARREIGGDSYPFGLELCVRAAMAWNLGADPLPALDQRAAIDRLKARARPGFVAAEVRRRLIDNAHRATLLAEPDARFHARLEAAEREGVERDAAAAGDAGRARLEAQARALAERQARVDDPDVLPDLELADVPRARRWAEPEPRDAGAERVHCFTQPTNGILHQLAALPLPALDDGELDLLPLLAQTIGQLGVGARDYAAQATALNASCGGLWGWGEIAGDADDLGRVHGFLVVECKGLAERQRDFAGFIAETLHAQRFDERERLRELVDQQLQRMQDAVQHRGSQLAARAAARGFAGAAALGHRHDGLGRLAALKALADRIDDDDRAVDALGADLSALARRIADGPRHLALVGDAATSADALDALARAWARPAGHLAATLAAPPAREAEPIAYTTATAVNYCALCLPGLPLGHADAPALAVAARLATNQVLHPRLREKGGAYGGSARWNASTGVLALTSYRDPRLAATFADLDDTLAWLAAAPDDARLMKEAILGVIAELDAPASPAGEGKARFLADLKGVGPARLNPLRAAILAVTPADVRRAARAHLDPRRARRAVVTSADAFAASGLGWRTQAI